MLWLVSLALICAIASLFVPIWNLRSTSSTGNSQTYLFSFGSYVSFYNSIWGSYSGTHFTSLSGLPSSLPTVLSVFIITTLAIIIPLVIVLYGFRREKLEVVKDKIRTPLLLAGLMSLISPLIFALLIPGAATASSSVTITFWGSVSFMGVTASFGPHVGWFLQLASLLLIIASIIVIYQSRTPKVHNS
jgi:hypothetical protein